MYDIVIRNGMLIDGSGAVFVVCGPVFPQVCGGGGLGSDREQQAGEQCADDSHELVFVQKFGVGLFELTFLFDKNLVETINHDLGDTFVAQKKF